MTLFLFLPTLLSVVGSICWPEPLSSNVRSCTCWWVVHVVHSPLIPARDCFHSGGQSDKSKYAPDVDWFCQDWKSNSRLRDDWCCSMAKVGNPSGLLVALFHLNLVIMCQPIRINLNHLTVNTFSWQYISVVQTF